MRSDCGVFGLAESLNNFLKFLSLLGFFVENIHRQVMQ